MAELASDVIFVCLTGLTLNFCWQLLRGVADL